MAEHWAIRRRNGGIDGNDAVLDDETLFGGEYGEWVEVVPAEQLRVAVEDREEMAALLTEAVRSDYGTPGWRARAIKAGCLTTTGQQADG